ncbi:hypothetical protein F3K27_23365 [Klebsiella grimontii]|nr:hypothetical protein [Klebsiella grimontii]
MFAGKKSAQIREILISESAWEEMTCLFAPSLVCALLLGWHYVLAQRYCSESAAVSIKASCIPREERRYVAPVLPRLRLPPRYGRFEVFIEMSSFRSSAVTRNFYPLHREPQLCGQQYCER